MLFMSCFFYDIKLLYIMMFMLDVVKHTTVSFKQSTNSLSD
ncbi:protein of unknown function [Xenorhabdus poinarii G6]|uniref:Uncharacterized protein n=1 Tax=Xenorhabdus poinarii G6 TaxID=1354304 RepID=A0A068R520_9GAMM|nr:protein of unknown function [Xenorhabdus poinarii G6]